MIEGDPYETAGVNSRAELAHLELEWQRRRREQALHEGATLIDPESVWFAYDTRLGRDVTVEPHVVFGPGVQVADGATIHAFSHIDGAIHRRPAQASARSPGSGPAPRSPNGPRSAISSSSRRPRSAKAPRSIICPMSATLRSARGANIGAGTITCNYDGFGKYRTVIGAGAFIGSNTALVAPVTVGEGAVVGRRLGDHRGRRAGQPGGGAQRAEGHRRLGEALPRADDAESRRIGAIRTCAGRR